LEVEEFVARAQETTGERIEEYNAFSFGDSSRMTDELATLVVSGRKRATTSLLTDYEVEGEPLPSVGAYSVVLDGRGVPVCLIRTVMVTVRAFRDVDESFAYDEGEGDLSLGYWQESHRRFFSRSLREFSEDSPVVCERFELVHALG